MRRNSMNCTTNRAMARAKTRAAFLVAACGLLIGAPALAQDDVKPGSAADAPVLQGPKVSDERAPGTDSRFSMGMERSRESERPIPLGVYEKELRKLSGEKAGDDVRLSAEQEAAIKKIIGEHRSAMRAFYQQHRDEIAAIRGGDRPSDAISPATRDSTRLGARRGDRQGANNRQNTDQTTDRRGDQNTGRSTDRNAGSDAGQSDKKTGQARRRGASRRAGQGAMSPEAREKMKALRAKGPQESVVISKIWGVLNETQRGRLQSRFEQIREDTMRKRGQRKIAQRRGAGGTDEGDGADRAPTRARQRLEAMTPEQRREAIERRRQKRSSSGSDAPVRPKDGKANAPKKDD